MGCDIHTFVEAKKNNTWYLFDKIDVRRDYDLFGLLAGVRSITYEPLFLPRGLPDNLSVALQIYHDYYKKDVHTESWFNRNEIYKIIKKINTINKKLDNKEELHFISSYFLEFYRDLIIENKIEDYRIIIWFDS